MGIRFDKDYKRATNGPVIFFSDASSEAAFAEEVNGAIISGLSFYSYRLPHAPMVTFGSSEGFVEGVGVPGFVIGRFDPSKPILTIPYKGCKTEKTVGADYVLPSVSTSKEEYLFEVEDFIRRLKGLPYGKIVAARVVVEDETLDLGEVFFDMSRRFPEAYIFCFSTPATGCWIGASPELLLESSNGLLHTMSLAGTRSVDTGEPWDEKNIKEQAIVTDYIVQTLSEAGLFPQAEDTYTKPAGSIEHICTPVNAILPESGFDLEGLLKKLSPTPALCGSPKEFAMEAIKNVESFDRGCYGGFCGPFHSLKDFSFNVVLRCASVSTQRYCLYAGGGITSQSSPSGEWQETLAKIQNIV